MIGVGAGIALSGAIGGLSSYLGGSSSARGAKKAAKLQWRQYLQTRKDLTPWREGGEKSLNALALRMGLGGDAGDPEYGYLTRRFGLQDFQTDPGYQFRLNEGEKAIDRATAARGGFFSGATGKALARYGQDYSSDEFNKAWSRDMESKNALYNYLAGLSGSGQSAAAQTGSIGANAAANAGQFYRATGDAMGAGYMGIGNALTGALGGYLNYAQVPNVLRQSSYGEIPDYAGQFAAKYGNPAFTLRR